MANVQMTTFVSGTLTRNTQTDTFHGIRVWTFTRPHKTKSNKPYLTIGLRCYELGKLVVGMSIHGAFEFLPARPTRSCRALKPGINELHSEAEGNDLTFIAPALVFMMSATMSPLMRAHVKIHINNNERMGTHHKDPRPPQK
jgi:hypothetical protein